MVDECPRRSAALTLVSHPVRLILCQRCERGLVLPGKRLECGEQGEPESGWPCGLRVTYGCEAGRFCGWFGIEIAGRAGDALVLLRPAYLRGAHRWRTGSCIVYRAHFFNTGRTRGAFSRR